MRILRLCWLGLAAREYEPMVRLLRDVMGLRVEFEEPSTVELSAENGDRVQVFAPANAYSDFLGEHAQGPVALFEADDALAARAELVSAGIELVGEIERDASWEWQHFRAPDGNLYALGSRRAEPEAGLEPAAPGLQNPCSTS